MNIDPVPLSSSILIVTIEPTKMIGIIIALIILIILSGFFSASETAFTSVSETRLKSLANTKKKSKIYIASL